MPRANPGTADDIIEKQLDTHLVALEEKVQADVLVFCGGLQYGVDDLIRDAIEDISPKRSQLTLVLETNGGYIEVVQRIATTFRSSYGRVEFIVPNHAMSAGTVLVMSGDAIYMDYYSVLGPIDPQVERPGGGGMIPALGYLVQYERLIEKSKAGELSTAELAYLIEKFNPAELYQYEQAQELSVALLKEWLVNYKFKNWTKTRTSGVDVTPQMREDRAEEIARLLNDTERWHSHSRGISMSVLRNDLRLEIADFGEDDQLNALIRRYYRLLVDYLGKMRYNMAVHRRDRFLGW
jgi:hypothetical protein